MTRTIEDIRTEASELLNEQNTSLNNSIKYSERCLESGEKIMSVLNEQSEQLDRIEKKTSKINQALVYSGEILKKMSFFHWFKKNDTKTQKLLKNNDSNNFNNSNDSNDLNYNSFNDDILDDSNNVKKPKDLSIDNINTTDHLNIINNNVKKLKVYAESISDELDRHNSKLDKINNNVEKNNFNLNVVNKKIQKELK
jgi:hypothetical protein